MSINRNVNLIKAIQPEVNRDGVRYNFSADIYAVGAGGGGESASAGGSNGIAGGGGGAGSVVSASLSVVPNITWTIDVGSGGASDTNGEDTSAIIYDDTYAGLVTLRAQGGLSPTNSGGGNQGSGSVETTSVTSSYSPFTGGGVNVNVAGGGAGAIENGGNGVPFDGNPNTGVGGLGGQGITDLPFGGGTLSFAGGGGGGVNDGQLVGGDGADGGGDGGDIVTFNGNNATLYGAGGGGGSTDTNVFGSGGAGSKGLVMLRFLGTIGTGSGEFDIEFTNASSSLDGNTTSIFYDEGVGTFRYNAPFPYVPGN